MLTTTHKIIILSLAAVLLRLLAASVGDNYDMESWWIASEAVLSGRPVYEVTHRYNYGPLWSYIIAFLRCLSALTGPDTITRLHLFMATFLSLVDVALALLAFRARSLFLLAAFLLNPIQVIVTGYHIQFDNLAILFGLLSWQSLLSRSSVRSTIIAGLVFGLSLSLKHVFAVFIIWLPLLTGVGTLKIRLTYGALGLSIFLLSFAPWINSPPAWNGIVGNVFGYVSTEGHTLVSLIGSFFPGIPHRTLFLATLTLAGIAVFRRRDLHRAAPFLYLITITALSSGMARNYVAIPLVAIFSSLGAICALPYLFIATLALVTVNDGLGSTEVVAQLFHSPLISYEVAQLALLGIFVEVLVRRPRVFSYHKITG